MYFEVRVGCYRQDPVQFPRRFLFRWELLKKDDENDLPEELKVCVREDFVLPEIGDQMTLQLMSSDWSQVVHDFGIIRPRDQFRFRVFNQEGDLIVKDASEGRYAVIFKATRDEGADSETALYDAKPGDTVTTIRDALILAINKAQRKKPILIPIARASMGSSITLAMRNNLGQDGEITKNPNLPQVITAIGPASDALVRVPRERQALIQDGKRPSEFLEELAKSNSYNVIPAIEAYLHRRIEPTYLSFLTQFIDDPKSGVTADNARMAVSNLKQKIPEFCGDLFSHVAKTFVGRNTDLYHGRERKVVADLDGAAKLTTANLTDQFARGAANLINSVFAADSITPANVGISGMARDKSEAFLQEEILKETPLLARAMGDSQNRLATLITAIGSGQMVDAIPDSGGSTESHSVGWLMGFEEYFDVPDDLVENGGAGRVFKNVNCRLLWTSQKLGQTIESRTDLRGARNCLNLSLFQDNVPEPEAYFVEDGHFSEENTLEPKSGKAMQNVVFIPTAGDGVVSIGVRGIGGEGAQYNAFSLLRTETNDPPLPEQRTGADVVTCQDTNPSDPRVLTLGTDRRQPFSFLKKGARHIVRRVDDVHATEMIVVDEGGNEIDDSIDNLLMKQEELLQREPNADLSEIVNKKRMPPYGKTYYYWLFTRSLGGDWRGPIPVTRDSRPKESKAAPRGLLLPSRYASEPAAMPILYARVMSEPPLVGRPRTNDSEHQSSDALSIVVDTNLPSDYAAELVIDNKVVPASNGETDLMARYTAVFNVSSFNFLLFRRIPQVEIDPSRSFEPASRRSLASEAGLVADKAYYEKSTWYVSIIDGGWEFVGMTGIPIDNADPGEGRYRLRYAEEGSPHVGTSSIYGGWEYMAVIVAKRSEDLCYQVPRVQGEQGHDPNSIPEFPVVLVEQDKHGRVAPFNGHLAPRPYVLRQGNDNAGSDIPAEDYRAVRFEHSNPSITLPSYAPATLRHFAPRIEGIQTSE